MLLASGHHADNRVKLVRDDVHKSYNLTLKLKHSQILLASRVIQPCQHEGRD
jgi:hypothetical protein